MDPLLGMSTRSTSGAQQASDNISIDCSSNNLGASAASSPGYASAVGVKKHSSQKASADYLECQSGTDVESHRLQQQQQQQQHCRMRKWKGKAKCKHLRNYLMCALTTVTLVFLVYHHVSNWERPQGRNHKEATAASTAGPDARGVSTSSVLPTSSSAPQQQWRMPQMDWIHVSIDMLAVDNCTGSRVASRKPCKMNARYITSDADALAPLRCVDDAFLENRNSSQNHCTAEATRQAFQLLASKGRVRVTQPGLYMLIGHVTVRLREAAELHFGVAVNQQLPFLCTVQSPGAGEDQPVPYSHCSVKGVRKLRAGDEVWLLVPHGNVPLQSLYKSTFLQVVRLSG